MSLRHALLGMLSIGPMAGYDLLEHFHKSAGIVWSASQAQIYPELRDMEADGLLTAKEAKRGVHGRKRIYSVTRKGMDELRTWVQAPINYPPLRDPARLKVNYLDVATLDDAEPLFKAHIAHYTARLQFAEEQLKRLRAGDTRRLARRDAEDHEMILAYMGLVAEGLVASATAEIAWGKRGLEITARLREGKRAVPARAVRRAKAAGA
jgi:PadR family transcriptional regulator AphA